MGLQTFATKCLDGQIVKVTEHSNDIYSLTVEVASEKRAYRFSSAMSYRPAIGSHVRFRGSGKYEVSRSGIEKKVEYYHEPHDGTNKSEWCYRDIRDINELSRISGPEVMIMLGSARSMANALCDDHDFVRSDQKNLELGVDAFKRAIAWMEEELRRQKQDPGPDLSL